MTLSACGLETLGWCIFKRLWLGGDITSNNGGEMELGKRLPSLGLQLSMPTLEVLLWPLMFLLVAGTVRELPGNCKLFSYIQLFVQLFKGGVWLLF